MSTPFRVLAIIIGITATAAGLFLSVIHPIQIKNIISNTPAYAANITTVEVSDISRKTGATYVINFKYTDPQDGMEKSGFVGDVKNYDRNATTISVHEDPKNPGKFITEDQISFRVIAMGLGFAAIGCLLIGVGVSKRINAAVEQGALSTQAMRLPGMKTKAGANAGNQESSLASTAIILSIFNMLLITIPIVAPISIVVGLLALRDIEKHPKKTGKGRAYAAIIISLFFGIGLAIMLIAND